MAGRFVTPLVVESLATDDRRNARLARPLVFEAPDGARYEVPAGFETDLASIPQLLQALIGKWERHAPAAVLHDWLYDRQTTTRGEADWLFAVALHAAGVPLWKRAAMWLAVRAGGGRAWGRNRRRNRDARGGTDMAIFTREAMQAFAPRPRDPRKAAVWDGYVDALVEHGDALAAEFGVDEPLEVQHLMAQVGHECAGFTLLWESGAYSASRILTIFGVGRHSAGVTESEANALAGRPEALFERVYGLGNPRKARELGNTEPGDGWRYRGFGPMQTTGRRDHERLLDGDTTPLAALRAAFREWDEKGCNELARGNDIKTITRRINGGYNGLADRRAWLAKAKKVWRVLPGNTGAAPPPATMAASTTGNTALALGAGGSVTTANEVSNAMAIVARSGNGFSLGEFALALAQSPTFWIAVLTVAGAAYVWLERRRKLIVHGV